MKELEKLKQAVLDKSLPEGMAVRVVAVDGHGGAGKSTLAAQLAKELNAEVLHTDDFASWDNPYDWWPRLIEEALEPVKNNARTLNYERSSWAPDHHPEPVHDQPVTLIMILEGVSSSRKEFRQYLTYTIWVETPKDVCIARGLERDGQDRLEQWEKWWAKEEEYIKRDNPKAYADLIVSGENEGA